LDRLGIAAAPIILLQQAILHASIRILDLPSIKLMGNISSKPQAQTDCHHGCNGVSFGDDGTLK